MHGSPARQAELRRRRYARVPPSRSSFAGSRFPPDHGGSASVPVLWALRDVEELLAERGIKVDHVTNLSLGAPVHHAADRCVSQGTDEIFAVVRLDNTRAAATVRRNG